jgi:hypothetical protein
MSFQLFDRIRALLRSANVYQYDQIFQDQSDINRIISGNEFLDLSRQNSLLQQTTLQINRLERYKDFDQMDEVGEITLALDMYADEASLIDPETGHAIQIQARSKRLRLELEHLFHEILMIDRQLRPLIRYLCKYGDFAAEIVTNASRDAVQFLRFINVYNFTRIETKFGDLVGFHFIDPGSTQPTFLHPWQVMHNRLTSYENIYHPYGRAVLDGARKDFKRLRLMEDAALVYRITRAPEKRVFSIPVGNIPPREIDEYIQRIAQRFKKDRFVDPATGNVNERYNPLIQDDDFFLPKRPDGTGPTIDTLPGAQNLDEIADIEYFKKKMISALKIPFARVGLGDAEDSDGRSLASSSPEFAKAIQWIQREVALGLKKVAVTHLALQGFPIEDIRDFDITMTASSAIDELYRIETWNSRADIMARLRESQMFDDDWIVTTFTPVTLDEAREMREKVKSQMQAQTGPLGQGGGPMGLPIPESKQTQLELDLSIHDADDEEYSSLITEARNIDNEIKERHRDLVEDTIYEKEGIKIKKELDGMILLNEFDGLPSPKNGEGLLVEYSVDADVRAEVLKETKKLVQGLLTETKSLDIDIEIPDEAGNLTD